MSRIRQTARRYWFDLLIVALAFVGLLEFLFFDGAPDTPLWLAVSVIAGSVLVIVCRRRFPFAAPAGYWVLATAISFVEPLLLPFMQSFFVIGMATAFLLGNLRSPVKSALGLGIVAVGTTILVYNIPGHSTPELVFVPIEFSISWVAGFALRGRSQQAEAAELRALAAERERNAAARIAVAEERARIARELHDIVAHSVSVMVLQVGAVRHNLPDELGEDAEALQGVERTGRTALAEMRRLLGAMRREGDELELTPQPGLDGLDSLLAEVGRAGLPVELHVGGERTPLPRAIDLSAYRIVQEGLTNALKHAHATRVDVTLQYAPDELQIEIRDDGQGTTTTDGLGHGLVGVRERVKIYGGEMTAAPAADGGFVLSTRLPLGRDRA